MFRRILCPVDFSGASRAALKWAGRLVQRSGGRLTVLFVNDPLLTKAAAATYDERALARATQAELESFVRKAVGPTRATRARLILATGRPGDAILDAARRTRADLIVMGTRGASGLSKLVLGSTTDHVLRKVATVPVVAVPARARS